MISQSTIDEIKERASLIDLVGERTQLKRNGSRYVALCPFHAEKTPSFHIRDNGRSYHCFGCGVSGNVLTYIMESRGLSFPDAVEELAARYGIQVQHEGKQSHRPDAPHKDTLYSLNAVAQEFFRSQLSSAEPIVREYLKSRKLGPRALQEFGFGFAPKGWSGLAEHLKNQKFDEAVLLQSGLIRRSPRGDLYDTFRARLMVPIVVEGRKIAGFGGRVVPGLLDENASRSAPKYLNSPETAIYQKNKILFGLPQALETARRAKEAYLVEGYMDVIGLWQAGVRNVVATCGTAVSDQHVKRLEHLVERVYVLFDGDIAGRTAAAKCFGIFLNSGIEVSALFIPEDEDPDTIALKHGDRTEEYLRSLDRVPLIDCYIDSLLYRSGWKEAKDLGAAAKGRLAEEVAALLRKVRNTVEQSELIERAAMRLLVDPATLGTFVKQAGQSAAIELAPQRVAPASNVETIGSVPIEKLPRLDQELLRAVMVLKDTVTGDLLRDADLCEGVRALTLRFIEGLDSIMAEAQHSEESKREATKALLGDFGESWTAHWRSSYQMCNDPDVNFERSIAECRRHIKKDKLKQAIREINERLTQSEDEHDKAELAHEQILLKRRLEQL